MTPTDRQTLLTWCADLVCETISEADFARLQAALAADAEARSIYVGYVHLHRALVLWSATDAADNADPAASADRSEETSQAVSLPAIVAEAGLPQPRALGPAPIGSLNWLHAALSPRAISLCILAGLLTYFGSLLLSLIHQQRRVANVAAMSAPVRRPGAEVPAGPGRSVERLVQSSDVQWRDGKWREQPGKLELEALQLLNLDAGAAQFDLTGGTRVVVVAPARFRIESAARVWLERGQLVAHVGPQARGFTVATPTAEVVDLGTEFGVEVEESADTHVFVRQGTVDVKAAPSAASSRSQEPQRLGAGQGVRITNGGEVARLTPAELRREDERFLRSAAALSAEGHDAPKLLAWYRMGEDDPAPAPEGPATLATLPNAAGRSVVPLKILGTAIYTDQVAAPGSGRALVFGPEAASSANALNWDVEPVDDFVLTAWVRVESVDETLLVVHWGEAANGVSLALMGGQWCSIYQGVSYLTTGVTYEPNQWTQLALVRERGQANFYVDGQVVGGPWFEQPKPAAKSITIGHGRGFHGQIDEVRLIDIRSGFRREMLQE